MLVFLLSVAGALFGQPEAASPPGQPPVQPPEIRRLVRQLDADDLASREAAEKSLIDLGPAALELLPPTTPGMPAEVRVRIGRIRQALQLQAAEQAARGSRIRLEGEMKLSAALAALEQQSGNKIADLRERFGQQATDPTVQVKLQNELFWPALDQLLDQVGLTVYQYSGQPGTLGVVAASQGETARAKRAAYSELFRLEGVALVARRDLRNPSQDALRLTLEVTWEPRVAPIVLQVPLDQVQAVDQDGRALGIEASPGRLEIAVQSDIPAAEIQIPFQLPDRQARQIASLKGRLDALVPGRTHEFVFEDLGAKAVELRTAGVTVTLDQVRKNVDVYEARIRVRFDQADQALESHRGWIFENEAYLLDAQGQRIERAGLQVTLQRPEEVGVSYLFDHEGPLTGCKFVYRTPVVIIPMPVPFELQDLPLP